MEKIELTKHDIIARGGERDCYIHPLDSTKVIKIMYETNGIMAYNGARNDIEYKYFKFLEKSNTPFSHITKCYGFVETNVGKGLVFDKVYDYNGQTSTSFLDILMQKKLTKKKENNMILELKEYIFENNILFIDYGLDNILCCQYEKDNYKLIIIDGLGSKRNGFKLWLYLNSKIYTKYKIITQWKKLLRLIERVKIER
ncbi:YrbL family protein [Aliarcobacter vitoriensis]|uniref:YrbL family protein n=1 Tax=Aliarcobacter vitoriensis TaxID=2011099 RepID=UPI001C9C579A|nr:YrbL family protein [Aliarcobacter vitoriensis]